MRRIIALLSGVVLSVATASCVAERAEAGKRARLEAFESCRALLDYAEQQASRVLVPYFFGDGVIVASTTQGAAILDAARGGGAGGDYSTTNVQEAGVDEPDLVKTDGATVFAVAQGKLQAVDVSGPAPRLVDSLALPEGWNHQLLLAGDRLLVLTSGASFVEPRPVVGAVVLDPWFYGLPRTTLSEVDVSDPASLRITETLEVDATFLAARLAGSTARVVLVSSPLIAFPTFGGVAAPTAGDRSRAASAKTRLRSWIPSYRRENPRTGRRKQRSLVDCDAVRHPPEFSGVDLLTVLTIDLARGLRPVDSDAIMTSGQTVYASRESLYVATLRWGDAASLGERTTALHRFDVADAHETRYRASGAVAGSLIDPWSLSEHAGTLRVATTEWPSWTTPEREIESFVSVLRERDGELVQVGRVGGLGRGEFIRAVRFMGDVGFVVTFRQVDPLYALDLADPERPQVAGELEIPGYSAYLHPVGEGLLLGVGQDATDDGRLTGAQLSLFDVSDLHRPARLHRQTVGENGSEAEWDHHAFLYWPNTELAVLPIATGWGAFGSAIGYRVGRSGIGEVGRVVHPLPDLASGSGSQIRRSLVVGDTLVTVSEAGLKTSDLLTLADRAWVPF